jgi:predicted AAA+ superfamily ATPase
LADLARRAEFYEIHPMNYREYLKFFHNVEVPAFTIEELVKNHEKISMEYSIHGHKQIYFEDFIRRGQYPYIRQYEGDDYLLKFQALMDKVIFDDLPMFINLQTDSLDKIRRLLYFISHTSPSELSFTGLSNKI